ncbi:hypothetical protein FNV43_RR20327 [Rhamnella rubrinervis]|uniref:At1g61320/AtMIF1 LRR domain-containing protein n=1 Tax=Rhamnella rubrinervis TaxID=2594499 RepID=A0A8K0DVQ4_9ROSA|nr:hypothetical protein FNV43_RR20327 [Rhamnella rubrinervis]
MTESVSYRKKFLQSYCLKPSIATSILSRRWRYVWASTTTLNIDYHDFEAHCFKKNKPEHLMPSRYLEWVDSILEQHKGPKVDYFRVDSFHRNIRYGFTFYKWIQFAMRKRVEKLELRLHYTYNSFESFFWPTTASKLKDHIDDDECSFKSLKVLHLENVDVSGELLEYMLSSYPALERLKVCLSKGLVRLRVAGGRKSLALKHLNIKACLGIQSVEICGADQVVSFSLDCYYKCEVRLENVPKLVKVSLYDFSSLRSVEDSIYFAFNLLSCCLSQLQILRLCFIKEASPRLEELVLKLSSASPLLGGKDEYVKVDKYAHEHLKKLELFCYSAPQRWIEIARYIVENAVALEKFTLFPKCDEGGSDHVIDQLKTIIPSTVEFERRF